MSVKHFTRTFDRVWTSRDGLQHIVTAQSPRTNCGIFPRRIDTLYWGGSKEPTCLQCVARLV